MLLFFDVALTSMAVDMSKGLPVLGYKLYLQSVALTDTKLILPNLNKYIALKNSYQNRPPIGLSILWALGQVGVRDLQAGLKGNIIYLCVYLTVVNKMDNLVFQEVMLPLIEMKNYTRYVVEYLVNIIKSDSDSFVTKEQYLLLLNVIFSSKKNFPSDLNNQLIETASKLNVLLLEQNKDKKYNSFIEPFIKKLSDNNNVQYQNNICYVIATCLMRDPVSFENWNKIYLKHLPQSALVLKYIGEF